ncbi:MAG: F0F1 ATP synthase subunit gamma [Legionellales bacterium]|nr:MAG: F0F1 ATP synthase subunit gamma [Legionellales bacterium]
MSNTREVVTKINSVKSTQKITRAMQMVAASKMKRAQNSMRVSRPYAKQIQQVMHHLATANTDYEHPFMADRSVQRVGYIVIATDKGLCGGLNVNLFKALLKDMQVWHNKGVAVDIATIGKKGKAFLGKFNANIVAAVDNMADIPSIMELTGAIKVMLDLYNNDKVDRIFIVYNEFINTMTQTPKVEQLVPIAADPQNTKITQHSWDYIYEPAPEQLLDLLLQRYIESVVYQAVVENKASEQAARMLAMQSATDNAKELIDDLELMYNKARQAAITQEIAEVVSGAAAI